MSRVLVAIDRELIEQLMGFAEVSAEYDDVEWRTDKLTGHMDNWQWWADRRLSDFDRRQINIVELMDAIYDGMAPEDRHEIFFNSKEGRRWARLRKWMGIDR